MNQMSTLMNYTSSEFTFEQLNTTTERRPTPQWDLSQWNSYQFKTVFLPSFIYILLVYVIGLFGNSLVCYIYHFKVRVQKRRLSTSIFILALSWIDLINVFFTLPFELGILFNFVQIDQAILCKMTRFITFFCNNSNSIILLIIAIDRLRGFLPGPRRSRLEPRTSKFLVFVAIFISALISWPMLVFFGTWTFPLPNGIIGTTCLVTNEYVNSTAMLTFTVTLLILHLCFDVSFIILYSLIGKGICYSSAVTSRLSETASRMSSLIVEVRKGSDSSVDDDVFVLNKDVGQQPLMHSIDNSLLTANDSRTNLVNLFPSNATINLSPKETKIRRSLYIGLIKRSDTLRNSIKAHLRPRYTRDSSGTSEWRIFNRHFTASRTSMMLFLVTVAYMATFLPYCILVVVRTVNPLFYYGLSTAEKAVYHLFLRSYCLGSAVNPIIYSFVNPSFRRKCKEALKDILCCNRT